MIEEASDEGRLQPLWSTAENDGKPGYSLAVSAQKLLPPPGQGPVFTIKPDVSGAYKLVEVDRIELIRSRKP